MSHQLIFPKVTWCEFLLILDFLSIKDRLICGSINKSAFVHISTREKNLHYATKSNSNLSRFLSNGYRQERILLVSYPRCGNSLLRQLLEKQTGIATGSDSRSNRPLAASLIRCGFKGEGIVDSSVWIVKTHYPERMGYVKCKGDRVILLVRNPFDALESYFHMGMTNTHDQSLTDEAFQSVYSIWEEFVVNEAKVWNDFYLHWLSVAESAQVPTLVLRYEDLALHTNESMSQVMHFLQCGRVPGPATSSNNCHSTKGHVNHIRSSSSSNNNISSSNNSNSFCQKKSNDYKGSYYINLLECQRSLMNTSTTAATAIASAPAGSLINNTHNGFATAALENNGKYDTNRSSFNHSNYNNNNSNNTAINEIRVNSTSAAVVTSDDIKIGYKPKKGGVGKGLKRMHSTSIAAVCKGSAECMDLFGYSLSTTTSSSSSVLASSSSSSSMLRSSSPLSSSSVLPSSSSCMLPSSSSSSSSLSLNVTPISSRLTTRGHSSSGDNSNLNHFVYSTSTSTSTTTTTTTTTATTITPTTSSFSLCYVSVVNLNIPQSIDSHHHTNGSSNNSSSGSKSSNNIVNSSTNNSDDNHNMSNNSSNNINSEEYNPPITTTATITKTTAINFATSSSAFVFLHNSITSSSTGSGTSSSSGTSISSGTSGGVWINDASFSIRQENDRFGRNFTYTRRDITCDDTQPLPTLSSSSSS